MQPKDPDLLVMYLEWALRDAERENIDYRGSPDLGPGLSSALVGALEKYGHRKADYFDRLNAISVMQQVEDEGFHGSERFRETALRLRRAKGGPSVDKIRGWWDRRHETPHLLDERRLSRKRGRPKKT